jgi:hypothetical protein
MKRIGRYLITAVGLMSVCGGSLFARDRDYTRERREVRRYEVRRYEVRHDYRRFDRCR